jgi:hypothetical protein
LIPDIRELSFNHVGGHVSVQIFQRALQFWELRYKYAYLLGDEQGNPGNNPASCSGRVTLKALEDARSLRVYEVHATVASAN